MTARRIAIILGGLVAVAAIDGSVNGPTARTAVLTVAYLVLAGLVAYVIDRRGVRA